MMKYKEVFLILKMSFKFPLKNVLEGRKKENHFGCILMDRGKKKVFNYGFLKVAVCYLYQNKPFDKTQL